MSHTEPCLHWLYSTGSAEQESFMAFLFCLAEYTVFAEIVLLIK